MNSEELFAILKGNGLHTIHIQVTAPTETNTVLKMVGELSDFIKSVKSLNENVVFVSILKFDESDFTYTPESDNGIFDEDEYLEEVIPQPIDLSKILPKIHDYRKYLDRECAFELSVFFKNRVLKYCQAEEWWLQFQELRDNAIEQIVGQEDVRRKKLGEENIQRNQELLDKLSTLIEDSDFVRLFTRKGATQRAMKSYALEAIPELQELNPELLSYGIQELNDSIRVKKTLKK